jgi:hypothetical protein
MKLENALRSWNCIIKGQQWPGAICLVIRPSECIGDVARGAGRGLAVASCAGGAGGGGGEQVRAAGGGGDAGIGKRLSPRQLTKSYLST